MPTGHTSALARAGHTPYAVLEVDEHYLDQVIDATVAARGRAAQPQPGPARPGQGGGHDGVAVADRAARPRRHPRHRQRRRSDGRLGRPGRDQADLGRLRPALARRLVGVPRVRCPDRARSGERLALLGCDLRRPAADWSRGRRRGRRPGRRAPRGVAAAAGSDQPRQRGHRARGRRPVRGTTRPTRSPAWRQVASIAGRYATVERDGRTIRLLLAKNPAGWLEAFEMAEPAPTLLSINARDPDGLDTSWLYDVDFSPLAGRRVLITGDRAMDLAVRLEVNEVPFEHVTVVRAGARRGATRAARGDRQLHRVPGHPSGAGPCQLIAHPATGPTDADSVRRVGPAGRVALPRPALHVRRPRQHADHRPAGPRAGHPGRDGGGPLRSARAGARRHLSHGRRRGRAAGPGRPTAQRRPRAAPGGGAGRRALRGVRRLPARRHVILRQGRAVHRPRAARPALRPRRDPRGRRARRYAGAGARPADADRVREPRRADPPRPRPHPAGPGERPASATTDAPRGCGPGASSARTCTVRRWPATRPSPTC